MQNIKVLVFIISVFLVSNIFIYPQETEYKLKEIVVTASKTPLNITHLARTVLVIDTLEINSIPVNNIQDLLKYAGSVDLRLRGTEGVQGDASIRGGTFEQTLILINGIKISDAQTGHHNLNIPLPLKNIERIEILKGQGSRVFGPNALSGAINIITKKGDEPSLSFSVLGGEHSLYETSVFASYPLSILGNSFSYSKKKSDGYRHNTDFDITNISFNQSITLEKFRTDILFGYIEKKFGANSFYTDRYPDQWERTRTKIFTATSNIEFENLIITPKLYWRWNDDDYRLDNRRPEWYRNIHKTDTYGAEVQTTIETGIGTTSISGEITKEEITSTKLGIHQRGKGGISSELNFQIGKKIFISTGFFVYNYSTIGWKIWPGIDALYEISDLLRIKGSAGKGFRLPTYTELYYSSPASTGNPNLKYEEVNDYELGIAYTQINLEVNANIFLKEGRNLIDWVRLTSNEPWKAENVTNQTTVGAEINFTYNTEDEFNGLPLTKIGLQYTYLHTDRNAGSYQSEYLLEYLRNQVIINVSNKLPFGIKQDWNLRIEERENYGTNIVADTQLTSCIENFKIFVRCNNLFDKTYFDYSGVIMPGRWLSAGVEFNIR